MRLPQSFPQAPPLQRLYSITRMLKFLFGEKLRTVDSNVVGPVLTSGAAQQVERMFDGFSLSSVRWKVPIGPAQLLPVVSTYFVVLK